MFRGLGHLVRSMFGGRRRGATSSPDMERTGDREMQGEGPAPGDTLRRAMDAASRAQAADSKPQQEAQAAAREPWPATDDHDLPTLFLHGRASPPPRARAPRVKAPSRPRTRPLPEDAVWLTDAVVWSQCGAWRTFWLPPTDPETSARIAGFIAHAAAGDLEIWGRLPGEAQWKPIKPAHWKKARLDPLAFLQGRENAFSLAAPPRARKADPEAPPREPVRYEALMVSRAAVEALFADPISAVA